MPQFKSTKEFVANELRKLKKLSDINRSLRVVALESQDMVATRVQQQGQNSAGAKMRTRSAEAYGAYSEPYGKRRAKRGFQTAHIDLTFEGSLWSAWRVFPINNKVIEVTFFGQEIEKAEWLEDMFGEVFSLTDEEEADIIELVNITVEKIMKS